MDTYEFIADDLSQTAELASQLASLFRPGTVVALDGDLGAGKTAFSQAVARALGVGGVVVSPTFTIIKEYEGTELPFYHMDVYRLSMEEADELGLDEYFYGDGVTLVEWASLIDDLLPAERLSIYIEYMSEHARRFRLVPVGEPYIHWCSRLKENGLLR
ncbi:tRNA threonylcarbamoyladenosine biosynthesis protein TsaE [Paenibacillus sp. UNCCL117]|uniref:tRNA (adenosine(37)-N6)-threonylcarbamoyltransferase complex ATPase subunit type 1 TsaE n=1 Tax=unclassified Paenibacillus TaxID=185978 RepID=UPI000882D6D6|nr:MULTISPECIES: tRNA (adenosine(37)-N6)-threonylcarbamoyltransferase complex ATPase subunit type 1 TsaE [unclassified Paenibacillus]SDE30924.1 tRNA threonylcarbamoyladenosine biosynthesis protein TsaE [Paenibacillus sp. cl123]SFW62996.1 tRNA threonylcarbamoyladenosine biosynthesis protein TsaE [Paenibacillus sp. UNCCL117]